MKFATMERKIRGGGDEEEEEEEEEIMKGEYGF